MQATLATAMEMHRTGKLDAAARLYRQVLDEEKDSPDALHLLGVLQHQKGEQESATELICKAISLRPSIPAYHANLAEVYRARGQLTRAVGCCRTAIRLWPEYPEAYCNLGMALLGQGKAPEAEAAFRTALLHQPGFATAHNALGTLLRDQRKVEEALEQFRAAVASDPGLAMARSNLGQLLLDRGSPAEALSHCQEAVRLEPDMAAAHNNLGNVLRSLDRLVEARASYAEALRLDPELVPAVASLGLTLHRDGRLGDALPWLQQAVELNPENATWWEYLGDLRMERDEHPEAAACYQRVLALEPNRASAHNALGWALQEEGQLEQATQHYQTALRLDPTLASAEINLGAVAEELGNLDEAERCFRSALRIQPRFALGHARLSTLLRRKLPDADLSALEARLADPRTVDEARSNLLFGLAQALDGRAEYPRAAECLREANALALAAAKRRFRHYEPAQHEQFVDRLIEAIGPEFIARINGSGSESRVPVFIFGLPRSGTTLIEQVLACHSRIHGAGELTLARRSFDSIPSILEQCESPLQGLTLLTDSTIGGLAARHLERLMALGRERSERIIDKMPDNYLYLGLLAAMFPRATYIHCTRDLRDVATSCWMTNFRSIRWANDPEHIASRFVQYRRLMDHWRRVLPITIHEVNYAETVQDLEGVAKRLVAACGLGWEPRCLEFHRSPRPVRTASVAQVRQPIYSHSLDRWRNYEVELDSLYRLLPGE